MKNLPQGLISADEAIKRLSPGDVPNRAAAWNTLCELVSDGGVRAFMINDNRSAFELSRGQFAGLKGRHILYVAGEVHWLDDEHRAVEIEGPPYHKLEDVHGRMVHGRVAFHEGDLERELASASEPKAADEPMDDTLRDVHVEGPAGKLSTDAVSVPRKRNRPALESAQLAIKELYPGDIPDQAAMPNAMLCRAASGKIKEAGRPDVSDDTILRAAGRRTDCE